MSEKSKSTENKPVYQNWWFWVIIAVAIIGLGAAASGNKSEETSSSNMTTSSETTTGSKSEEKTTYKVGETFTVDNVDMKVSSVERNFLPGNQYDRASDGMEYVKVTVEIENKTNDKISYNSTDWKMEDSSGDLKDYKITTESNTLSYGELTAGGKKSGFLIFEVPKDDAGLKVHYSPTFSFSNKDVIVEL